MAIHPIVTFGAPALKKVARRVERVTPELLRLTEDMFETMRQAKGVGLAANQIDIDLAVSVISFRETLLTMFNPRIIAGTGTQSNVEACLSVPGVEGEVKRAAEVTFTYLDERGELQERSVSGHLARIVQHELDHLNGVLIVNHLSIAARTLHKKTLERLKAENVQPRKQVHR
ncbi:MAG: peptide deformylase [Candidatus Riflebacteria bacterium]|nr:peptide deformylase [Candidatus Riflebacteria bacterium]